MLFAPNGPLVTVISALTYPLPSAVTPCMPVRLQSSGPVAVPFAAHCVTTSGSPGEKPDAWTCTCWPDLSPVAGITVICWAPPPAAIAGGVGMADAAAGAVVAGGGAVVVGLRVTMAGLLPHPAARATSPAAAA